MAKRISALPYNKERGDAFEIFADADCAMQKIEHRVLLETG
jgi:hypothetical protein